MSQNLDKDKRYTDHTQTKDYNRAKEYTMIDLELFLRSQFR